MAGLKVGISSDETTAILQADSTTQGALVPRMTTAQRDLIAAPATGLLVYNTTTSQFNFYNSAAWIALSTGGAAAPAGAQYLVLALDGTLSAERRLTPNTPLVATDGGANADYDLDLPISALAEEAAPAANDWLLMEVNAGGTFKKVQVSNVGSAVAAGEIFLTASGGWPSTTTGCAASTKVETTTNKQNYYVLDFDQTTEEYAEWTIWMPDEWNAGTVTAKFCWTAAAGAGDVIWALQGRSYANDDAIDQAWGTAQTVTDTLITAGDVHYTSATAAITLAGTPAAGEVVQIRVYRDADAGGDTLTADARLIGVKIYYTKS